MSLINKSRNLVTGTVVAATIAWSMGLSALTAAAALPATGSLIKAPSYSTVYYLGADSKRYVFPSEKAYKTWYADFSTVNMITDAELTSLPLGGNVTYRPGVRMIKITTDPKVYAVSKGGVLHWVTSEAVAVALYGANWNQMIDDVADSFFTNYTIGSDINTASDFIPASATSASPSINVDKNIGTGVITVSGSVSAMLSSSQPIGGTIPKSATGVSMVKVDVRNSGSSAVTLDQMVVRRTGVGASSDFTHVYLYEGNNRLTTDRTINSSTNEATFGGVNVTLAAGETKTLWVSADMAAGAAGNENAIQVVSITSGTVAVAGLPVTGPTYRLAGSTVGSITIAANGTFTDAKAGANAKVAQFTLAAGSTEDVVLNKVALYFSGTTARENVTNLTLKQAGTTLATASGISSKDLATFVLTSPMTLTKGNTRTFEVYADIAGVAKAADTVVFSLDNDSDLYAVGATFGYGVSVVRYDYNNNGFLWNATNDSTVVGTDKSSVTIDAGSVNISYNGPAAKDVAVDSKDVELLNFTMTAQANVEVRHVNVSLLAANTAGTDDGLLDTTGDYVANYTDIKLVDVATGATVGGPLELDLTDSDTEQDLDFNSVFNMTAGQSRTFKVTLDVANNADLSAATADTITARLNAFAAGSIRNLDNNTNVTDIVPSGAITGNAGTLTSSSLTVSAASTPVGQTYIKGTQGAAIGGIILKAGDAAAMRVSSIALTPVQQDIVVADYNETILTAGLWNGSTQVGTSESPDNTSGVLSFSNLNLTVAAGQSVTLTLKANLSSTAATGDIRYKVDNSAVDVVVTDVDGSTKTAGPAATDINSNIMTIAAAGSVTVAKAADDSESEAGLVVAGSSNVVLAKYKFNATNEELKLTKVRMQTAAPTAVSSISLYNGSTLVGGPIGVDGSGNADFTGLNFVIPKDGSATLTVKGNLAAVGSSGATTNSKVDITLRDDVGTFEVRGTSSGSNTQIVDVGGDVLAAADGDDVAGNTKAIVKSKPTITRVALSDSLLRVGAKTVARFTVSADAAGDIALKQLPITVAVSGTTVPTYNSLGVRLVGGSTYIGTWAADVATFTSEEVVAAGTSKTYELVLNVTAADAEGDAIVTSITQPDSWAAAAAYASGTGVQWSDMSSSGHSESTLDWITGFEIDGLPTDSWTLIY